jgi:hypothetical protein
MIDIALGIASGLECFAARVNASYMSQWRDMGLFDQNVEGWGQAFEQVMTRTLTAGGRVHFNLTNLDVREALAGDPEFWVGRYTAWELQQIVRNKAWFDKTSFYLNEVALTSDQIIALGIVSP